MNSVIDLTVENSDVIDLCSETSTDELCSEDEFVFSRNCQLKRSLAQCLKTEESLDQTKRRDDQLEKDTENISPIPMEEDSIVLPNELSEIRDVSSILRVPDSLQSCPSSPKKLTERFSQVNTNTLMADTMEGRIEDGTSAGLWWDCPTCKEHNPKSTKKCHLCETEKPSSVYYYEIFIV